MKPQAKHRFLLHRVGRRFLAAGCAIALVLSPVAVVAVPIFNPANGHYYEVVLGLFTWTSAKSAAEAASHLGLSGHLATITSAAENTFVRNLGPSSDRYWLGGFQDTASPSYTEPAGGWAWSTREPFSYTNWSAGEPNNFGGNEGFLEILLSSGAWNDAPVNHILEDGYVIEYESRSDRVEPGAPSPATITGTGQCATIPVRLLKGWPWTNPRAFSVTFQLSSQLALCGSLGSSITDGTWGSGVSLPLQRIDLGGGRYRVDLTLTASNCITDDGVLFNVSVRSTVSGSTAGTLTVTAATLRNCANTADLSVDITGAATTVPINIGVIAAIADLFALQQRTGNTQPPNGTTDILLTFTPPGAGLTVELWRAAFGNYPAYDGFSKPLVATLVNFLPTGATPNGAYISDNGAVFNGTRGWDADRSSQMVTRNAASSDPDQHFVRMRNDGASAVWSLAVANGSHDVTVRCGDPLTTSTPYVVVEGNVLFDGNTTLNGSIGLLQSRSGTVNVADGVLTVVIGGAIPGRPDLFLTDTKVTQLSVDGALPPGGGSPGAPVAPTTYPPSAPWVNAGTITSGDADRTSTRDEWYYVAFVKDGGGNVSAASNRTDGTLNYHLGDVFVRNVGPGTTTNPGDNRVDTPDISHLGFNYGITVGGASSFATQILDIGPTKNSGFASRPLTDGRVQFEDLVILGGNFNVVSKTGPAPVAAAANELLVEAPRSTGSGDRFAASLWAQGAGDLLAMSVRLTWDASVVEPLGVAAGPFLADQGGVALSPEPGVVDLAVLGAGEIGLAGEGLAATVGFRAVGSGDPGIRIESIDARDLQNRAIEVRPGERADAAGAIPRVSALLHAAPNPFNPSTTLHFAVAERGRVEVAVYSAGGQKVRTLVHADLEAGLHEARWDGTDDRGHRVASGKYFARLAAGDVVSSRAVTLVK